MANNSNKNPLVGMTVNIYRKPETRQQFEGAAKVKKVISIDSETRLAKCRVKFKQNGLIGERFVQMSNLKEIPN